MHIGAITSTTVLSIALIHFDTYVFCHPILSEDEHLNGFRLVIDTWADTACAVKHAFVEAFIMVIFITERGFNTTLGCLNNIPISIFFNTCDAANSEIIILESKNSIYLCDNMENSLLNTIQASGVGVHVDTNPKRYYPDDTS